ncbi:MAG: hypothetical protein KAH32_07220 [Chlamydiia bacterium]|nr:hypothetical protein [Chlamydiia bacterium]
MPVQILKKKNKTTVSTKVKATKVKAKKATTHADAVEPLVASMAALEERIKPMLKRLAPLQKSYDATKAKLIKLSDEMYEPSEKGTFEFDGVVCEIGQKDNSTKITDKERAIEILQSLGEGVVLELVKFGITDLRTYLTPSEIEEVTMTSRTGKRSIKITKDE